MLPPIPWASRMNFWLALLCSVANSQSRENHEWSKLRYPLDWLRSTRAKFRRQNRIRNCCTAMFGQLYKTKPRARWWLSWSGVCLFWGLKKAYIYIYIYIKCILKVSRNSSFNPLNAELNPICHLLALLGGATIVVVSRLRVNCVMHLASDRIKTALFR